jgi:eukaryotic-like serine/threonine-protein kinase
MGTVPVDVPTQDDLQPSLGNADLAMQLALRSVMSGVLGRSHEISLGRYRVRERIGHGGCGLVLLAEDPQLDREVAIKVVLPTRAQESSASKWQDALQREARALARLRHPNVVEVFDAGTTEYLDEDTGELQPGVYLVMERLRGRTLRQWLAKQPRSWREIVDVHVQAARGLIAAHAVGIVHRDFKPDNVLLTEDGRVVLIDFGLADEARELDEPSSLDASDSNHGDVSVTRRSRIVGTPLYMAPEQHIGREVGPAADQYAWCVSLFSALYGRPPFAGDSMDEIVAHKFRGKLPGVAAPSGLPRALHRALARGLRVEPSARHPDIDALVRATQRATSGARRFVPMIAAGALASVATAAVMLGPVGAQHPCDDSTRGWADGWSMERRDEVASALARLPAANASALASRVVEQVDHHGRRWQAAHDTVCGRDSAREDVLAQLECLDRGLDQVTQVGDALAALTIDDFAQASPLLDGLRKPDECLVAAHGSDLEPAQREELAELWRRADELGVQVDASGQLADPAWAEAALLRADELGDAALASTIAWRLGQVARAAGRLDEGAAHMRTAVFRAAAAHDHPRALRLMPLLLLAVGSDLADHEEAERLFEHAQVMSAQLDDSREAIADCETSMAYILIERGDKDGALATYERVLATYESLPELPRELPRVRMAIAGAAIEAGDLDRASALLERASDELDRLSLPTDLNYATIEFLEGGIAEERGDYEAAHEGYASAVARLRVRLHGHPFVGVGLHGLGVVEKHMGRLDEATASLAEARDLALAAYGPANADTMRYELSLADASWRAGRHGIATEAVDRVIVALDDLPERKPEFLVDAHLLGAWAGWSGGDLERMDHHFAALRTMDVSSETSNVDFARSMRRLAAARALAQGDAQGAGDAMTQPIVTAVGEGHDPALERRLDEVMLALAGAASQPSAGELDRRRTSYYDAFLRNAESAMRIRSRASAAALPAAIGR